MTILVDGLSGGGKLLPSQSFRSGIMADVLRKAYRCCECEKAAEILLVWDAGTGLLPTCKLHKAFFARKIVDVEKADVEGEIELQAVAKSAALKRTERLGIMLDEQQTEELRKAFGIEAPVSWNDEAGEDDE